ncbi:MAG TPA: aminotransferase class V-fold PLP-dependent enzyme [Polyangiales bacterium]|jgi:cystathionine gamma-synthase|nr:aminotransferase class V-fold PLP-dependent enzyme [Polyangiales bacterium]
MHIETLSVHLGRDTDSATGAVAAGIPLSTTFERAADGSYPSGFSYARAGNPARQSLETCIAGLEGGSAALAFASGSAASLAVFGLLKVGDHVIAPRQCYHGTLKQLRELCSRWGVTTTFVDTTDLQAVAQAFTPNTRLVWIETPSNPTLLITDINAVCELARRHRALVCCDNTFATPVLQKPLALGADLVMHASSKYFGGHSDVLGGAVVVRDDKALFEQLFDYQVTAGSVPAPFDCWLVRRSLSTLPFRVRAQAEHARAVAEFLVRHPFVETVYYPGLPAHPGHALACTQMPNGFGAVLSFCVRGARAEAFAVTERLQLITRATSLGGVETLIEHRASIEGTGTLTPESLLRLSVGLEHPEDLIADLRSALDAAL